MPLNKDEMTKLSKAIFLSYDHFINGKQTISVSKVFNILNDYSPDFKARITSSGNMETLNLEKD